MFRMRLALALLALIAAIGIACGDDDDDGGGGATTAPASGTASAGTDGTPTLGPSPTPSPTPSLFDKNGEITATHPLVLTIAARYLSLIPPVSLTSPPSCEGINAAYDKASDAEKPQIDAENIGRICIMKASSDFGEESASVTVGYYRSDAIETLEMVRQSGAWVITN